jgi:predicted DNA-binding protein YlxM (UPF0122 family)
MRKLTVSETADELGITKEAIYNRIRRGTLKSVVEGEEKYIILDEDDAPPTNKQTATLKFKKTIPDERYVNLLVSRIDELKAANSELNKDKDRLIKEKEQLLIEQRVALETIYKERDEQLKAILTLANRSLLANPAENAQSVTVDANYEQTFEEINDNNGEFTDWRELKSYLKAKGFSKKKKKKIILHVKEAAGEDEDVQEDEGVLYIRKERIEKFT